jgi:hypothetical protein
VTFVGGGNDARLVADIEKLIKTKIELEAIEFEEDQPNIRQQGRINDGRRMYHEDGSASNSGGGDNGRSGGRGDGRGEGRSRPREDGFRRSEGAPRSNFRPTQAPRDPFFDKPYEVSVSTQADTAPSWEASTKPVSRGVSANIKPKRTVAALFKTEV